jgi:hypothetical protein
VQGLKTLIRQECPKAVYVWCHSHRLNLVIQAAMSCNLEVKNVIGLLQELHDFFGGHRRHSILMEHQKRTSKNPLQLQRAQSTRWTSLPKAICTVKRIFASILSALDAIAVDSNMDVASVSGATGLGKRLRDFKVIIALIFLNEVFRIWGPVTRHLQGVGIDLSLASSLLSAGMKEMTTLRENADKAWKDIIHEAGLFAMTHNIDPHLNEERCRRRKRMHDEMSQDESVHGLDNLRTSMFLTTIDAIIVQMSDRFNDENRELLVQMAHFSSGKLSSKIGVENINILCSTYNLNAEEIIAELDDFRVVYHQYQENLTNPRNSARNTEQQNDYISDIQDESTDDEGAADVELEWNRNNFLQPLRLLSEISNYPHLKSLYKILISIPSTSCSAERSLSRLRIIKNRLRSSMTDSWLSSLMVLASEKDILQAIDLDELINKFAHQSALLKKSLMLQ